MTLKRYVRTHRKIILTLFIIAFVCITIIAFAVHSNKQSFTDNIGKETTTAETSTVDPSNTESVENTEENTGENPAGTGGVTDPTDGTTAAGGETTESPASGSDDDVTWQEVNQTVTATLNVRVRASYSTDSEELGMLLGDETVTRTAIGSNNWSKIDFEKDGEMVVGYVFSEYLK